jgi:hypothetical protein
MTAELLITLFFCGAIAFYIAGHVSRRISILGACALFCGINLFSPFIYLADLDLATKVTVSMVNLGMIFMTVFQIYNVIHYNAFDIKKRVEV